MRNDKRDWTIECKLSKEGFFIFAGTRLVLICFNNMGEVMQRLSPHSALFLSSSLQATPSPSVLSSTPSDTQHIFNSVLCRRFHKLSKTLLSSHFSPPSCAAGGEMCQTASRVLPDSSGSSMTFVQRCEGVELCCGWTSALNTFRVGSSSQQGHFLTWHYWVRNSVISTLEIFNDY